MPPCTTEFSAFWTSEPTCLIWKLLIVCAVTEADFSRSSGENVRFSPRMPCFSIARVQSKRMLLTSCNRQQMETWKKSEARQPALFELQTDYRPRAERTAAGRYREPTLLNGM